MEPVTQRQVHDLAKLIEEKLRSMENRVTLKIVVATIAASALGKQLGPSTMAALAALGVVGWTIKSVLVFLLHR